MKILLVKKLKDETSPLWKYHKGVSVFPKEENDINLGFYLQENTALFLQVQPVNIEGINRCLLLKPNT